MKRHIWFNMFLFALLFLLLVPTITYGQTQQFSYGFEDWTGDANTSPDYMFGGVSYWNDHITASEVVLSYTPDGYGEWTARTGSYFWLQCSSPCCALDPAVDGITSCDVNSHNMIGYASSTYGNGYPSVAFDLDSINGGELYVSFYARIVGFSSASGNCKWMRVYGNDEGDPNETIYMHITQDKKIAIYVNGAFRAYSGVLSDMQDGEWHKFSMYINYNDDEVYQWYDVGTETRANATISYSGSIPTANCGDRMYIQGNFSAKTPSSRAFCAVDDFEVWDGLPYDAGVTTTTTSSETTSTTTSIPTTTTTVPEELDEDYLFQETFNDADEDNLWISVIGDTWNDDDEAPVLEGAQSVNISGDKRYYADLPEDSYGTTAKIEITFEFQWNSGVSVDVYPFKIYTREAEEIGTFKLKYDTDHRFPVFYYNEGNAWLYDESYEVDTGETHYVKIIYDNTTFGKSTAVWKVYMTETEVYGDPLLRTAVGLDYLQVSRIYLEGGNAGMTDFDINIDNIKVKNIDIIHKCYGAPISGGGTLR